MYTLNWDSVPHRTDQTAAICWLDNKSDGQKNFGRKINTT